MSLRRRDRANSRRRTSRASSASFSRPIVTAVDARRGAARDRRSAMAASHHARVGRIALRRVLGRPAASTPLPPGAGACLRAARDGAHRPALPRIAERSPITRMACRTAAADPRLLPNSGIAIGEMPIIGPPAPSPARGRRRTTGSNDLPLMEMERERARQEKEERDKQRRDELEGKEAASRDMLPFEDFDVASRSTRSDGTRIITRAFTAGPGDYDLFVAWADPSSAKAGCDRARRPKRSRSNLPPRHDRAHHRAASSLPTASRSGRRPTLRQNRPRIRTRSG